jgi:hypothetical protein
VFTPSVLLIGFAGSAFLISSCGVLFGFSGVGAGFSTLVLSTGLSVFGSIAGLTSGGLSFTFLWDHKSSKAFLVFFTAFVLLVKISLGGTGFGASGVLEGDSIAGEVIVFGGFGGQNNPISDILP